MDLVVTCEVPQKIVLQTSVYI